MPNMLAAIISKLRGQYQAAARTCSAVLHLVTTLPPARFRRPLSEAPIFQYAIRSINSNYLRKVSIITQTRSALSGTIEQS